jgi:hypothetical protein
MFVRRLLAAGAVGLALVVLVAPGAVGYNGQVATSVSLSGPAGVAECATDLPVSVTVLDTAGRAVTETPVTWGWASTAVAGDSILDSTTTTDGRGSSITAVRLACVPGDRTLEARAGDAFGSLVLGVQAVALPRTDTSPVTMPWATIASLVVAAAGLLLVGRRILVRR